MKKFEDGLYRTDETTAIITTEDIATRNELDSYVKKEKYDKDKKQINRKISDKFADLKEYIGDLKELKKAYDKIKREYNDLNDDYNSFRRHNEEEFEKFKNSRTICLFKVGAKLELKKEHIVNCKLKLKTEVVKIKVVKGNIFYKLKGMFRWFEEERIISLYSCVDFEYITFPF